MSEEIKPTFKMTAVDKFQENLVHHLKRLLSDAEQGNLTGYSACLLYGKNVSKSTMLPDGSSIPSMVCHLDILKDKMRQTVEDVDMDGELWRLKYYGLEL
jgi:hypothetical protein